MSHRILNKVPKTKKDSFIIFWDIWKKPTSLSGTSTNFDRQLVLVFSKAWQLQKQNTQVGEYINMEMMTGAVYTALKNRAIMEIPAFMSFVYKIVFSRIVGSYVNVSDLYLEC